MASIKMAMERAKRRGTFLAVFYVDLDHFKGINDTLGHDIGDSLLKTMASRLTSSVRQNDLVSRIGGDEFAVLLDDIENVQSVMTIAQNMLDVVGLPINLAHEDINMTSSIGIALYPESGDNVSELVQSADTAMYRAKKSGRNNFCFYSNEMHNLAVEYTKVKNDLGSAIKNNEFELFYQPKFSAKTGYISGIEALIRWNHPQRGMVSPAEFIPIAENSGLISSIGEWVLMEACRQFKQWQTEDLFAGEKVTFSVNISANQLNQNNISQVVQSALEQNGIEGHLLELELTESVLIDDLKQCAETLHSLTKFGVRIALDDFGTGYASFRHMQRLPLHTLKIDKSFIETIDVDTKNAEVVSAIIAMGKALNLEIVAEGVETQPQESLLKKIDCDTLQGFYYSKPLPADEFSSLCHSLANKTKIKQK
jgi:diguanylate cyclase (GGDEF)-like protein